MNKEQRLLREYVREILNEDVKSSLFDVGRSAKGLGSTVAGMFGGGKAKSAPERWFAQFLKGQLDKTGKQISDYFSSQLDALLPDEVKKAIYAKKSKKPGDKSSGAYDDLAKVVDAFIKSAEKSSGKEIPEDNKNELLKYAGEVYAKAMESKSDEKAALGKVKNALVLKYSPKISAKDAKTSK